MAATSPGTAATDEVAEAFAFQPPEPNSAHRFKHLGSVYLSSTPYTASPLADTLYRSQSLLAVSKRYSRLFLVSPASPPSLLVAPTSAVLAAVSQAAAAASELDDESKRASMASAAFVSLPLSDGDGVWHLSLSSDEQWLLSIAGERCSLYHISQFAQPRADSPLKPLLSFEHPDVIVGVQWSPHHASLLYLLSSDGQLSAQQVSAAGVEEAGLIDSADTPITAFLLSSYSADELIYLAHADGSLDVSTADVDANKLSRRGYTVHDDADEDESNELRLRVQRRYRGRNPCPRDFAKQPVVHHISQLDARTLVLGHALSKCGDAQSPDYLMDDDVARVAACCFHLDSGEEYHWGDALEDELRLSADDKPYAARHRYSLLPLPPSATALLWSNRAGETVLVGPAPTGERSRWVPYALASEEDKAVVPFDDEFNDTCALGVGFAAVHTTSDASNNGAVIPLLIMLTSDASLHLYHFHSDQPTATLTDQQRGLSSVETIPASLNFADTVSTPTDSTVPLSDRSIEIHAADLDAVSPGVASSAPAVSPSAPPFVDSVSSSSTVSPAYMTPTTWMSAPTTPLPASGARTISAASPSTPAFVPIMVLAPHTPSTAARAADSSTPAVAASQPTVSPAVPAALDSRSSSPDAITFHYVLPTPPAAQSSSATGSAPPAASLHTDSNPSTSSVGSSLAVLLDAAPANAPPATAALLARQSPQSVTAEQSHSGVVESLLVAAPLTSAAAAATSADHHTARRLPGSDKPVLTELTPTSPPTVTFSGLQPSQHTTTPRPHSTERAAPEVLSSAAATSTSPHSNGLIPGTDVPVLTDLLPTHSPSASLSTAQHASHIQQPSVQPTRPPTAQQAPTEAVELLAGDDGGTSPPIADTPLDPASPNEPTTAAMPTVVHSDAVSTLPSGEVGSSSEPLPSGVQEGAANASSETRVEVTSQGAATSDDSDERSAGTSALAEPEQSSASAESTGATQTAVSELTAQFVSMTGELIQRQQQLAESREQLHALEQSTLSLHSHHSVLHSLHAQVASLTQQLSEQQSRADGLDSRLDQHSNHLEGVAAALESSERLRRSLQAAASAEANSHADVIRQLRAELAAAKAAAASASSASAEQYMVDPRLQSELAAIRADLVLSRQQLASSILLSQHQHEVATVNAQLASTQAAFAAAQTEAATLRRELSTAAATNKAAESAYGFAFKGNEFRLSLDAFAAHEQHLAALRAQLHASQPLTLNPLNITAAATSTGPPVQPGALSMLQAEQVTRHLLLSSRLAILGQDCVASLDRARREVEHLVRHEEGRSQKLRHAQKQLTKGKPLEMSSYSVSDQCSIS